MRWGIAEEQSTRKETLKLCLDEIKACRPFFIGLLGERYGWIPGDDAFSSDLKEEQPWLNDLHGKSVTELEILHGVLNNPEMAGRAYFYFRDPSYAAKRGEDFHSENNESAQKQDDLKKLIRASCANKNIPLHETYPEPAALAALVLEHLKTAIEVQFPLEDIPDPLDREALDHEAFAEIRCRTYIGRPDYYESLDSHAAGDGVPLVLLGDSGSGKSALLANWIKHWKEKHPNDFIFQHYIGGTADSSVHWKLMIRLMAEIKRWSDDTEELPRSNDDTLRDFPLWLSKARIKAERDGFRFIVVLDALNQLEDKDHGQLLGWLPEHPFKGALRLIVSTLPGESLDKLEKRKWLSLKVELLTIEERKRMIAEYLARFSKNLDDSRLNRIAESKTASNPLYLKILLDELRVTGAHDKLDELLNDYLGANDIPSLLSKVLARYQRDYEHDRKNLVSDSLSLIWAARRGITEVELLQLLKPDNLPQLPIATWAPLRGALEEGLINRGGILNFAHDFLRQAVEITFLPDLDKKDDYRIVLADYFEALPITARNCDELPWLLYYAELFQRLRNCLLDIDRFIEIFERDEDEFRAYWLSINEERSMGKAYVDSFNKWVTNKSSNHYSISFVANQLGLFMYHASLNNEAEILLRWGLEIDVDDFSNGQPDYIRLNNLAQLMQETNRLDEAEVLMRRALKIIEVIFGKDHQNAAIALNNLARLLQATNRQFEAEPLYKQALRIFESSFGDGHPYVIKTLNNLGWLLKVTNRHGEAETMMRKALKMNEESFGKNHPSLGLHLNNLAVLLQDTNRLGEAEPLMKRALEIDEGGFGKNHPNVAIRLNNLASLLKATNRLGEAEPLMRRALKIVEDNFGIAHPDVAFSLQNIAS
ncbi:MAG: tetratricopeptide repeat protein, partial [Chitinophagales bacterium]